MNSAKGAVVVTGASSGIGEACAVALAAAGYRVFAGVRTDEAAERLVSLAAPLLTPVEMDVCDQRQIDAAARLVAGELGPRGLAGLVNNAGIGVAGPLEFLPVDALRQQFEVNVIGQLAVTQAFLPALRSGGGRIVNMSSVSGRLALPFMGPYAASKFALEALSDSLRVELRPWNIHVALVEPGVIATPIWERSLAAADRLLADMPPAANSLYGRTVDIMRRRVLRMRGEPVDTVVRAVMHALTSRRPRARYLVGSDARLRVAMSWLPWKARDRAISRALS